MKNEDFGNLSTNGDANRHTHASNPHAASIITYNFTFEKDFLEIYQNILQKSPRGPLRAAFFAFFVTFLPQALAKTEFLLYNNS